MHSSQDQLLMVAARVLRRCANGQNPNTQDVQFLGSHALPCQIELNAAELAGTTVWRIQKTTETMTSAA
jgi:hypothetical protein